MATSTAGIFERWFHWADDLGYQLRLERFSVLLFGGWFGVAVVKIP